MAINKVKTEALKMSQIHKDATSEDFTRAVLAEVGLEDVEFDNFVVEGSPQPGDIIYQYKGTMFDAVYGIVIDDGQTVIGYARKIGENVYPQIVSPMMLEGWDKVFRIPVEKKKQSVKSEI